MSVLSTAVIDVINRSNPDNQNLKLGNIIDEALENGLTGVGVNKITVTDDQTEPSDPTEGDIWIRPVAEV